MGQHTYQKRFSSADRQPAEVSSPEGLHYSNSALAAMMGADFSGVRFHTGKAAEAKASAVDARAYTSGNDVYFGEGGFDPAVAAHELVHTAQ